MPRRKKPKLWSHTAGEPPFTVEVHERTPGGVLYERLWDPSGSRVIRGKRYKGAQRRRSLGHRDQEQAIAHAEAEAKMLRAGAEAMEGRPTVAGVLALYLLHRTPQKEAEETRKDDERHAEFWRTRYGSMLVSDLGDVEWNEVKRQRASGEYDARGRFVPEADRKPVGPRGVDATLVFINALFNWAIGFRVKGRKLITENPFGAPAPGVKRTLERPKNLSPAQPVATYDRFLKIREKAPLVMMAARKGEQGATLEQRGTAKYRHGEGPVHLWMRPSYLPELMDLAEATGRRISAICRLWYSDFIVGWYRDEAGAECRGVTHIRWRPFKGQKEQTIPVNADARAAVERILAARPGHGDHWVFPSPKSPSQPITRQLARAWLYEAEELANVTPRHLERGAWHPYRRKWATERKTLPDADVMKTGGWSDVRSLKASYQHADDETVLEVVNTPRKLMERKSS
jgi:hypothetical protein